MGSRDKVVTLAVTGGVLLALGVWTNHWWTAEGGVLKIGLREARACVPQFGCVSAPFSSIAELGEARSFFTYAKLTFWLGLLGAALLFAHAYLLSQRGERRVGWAAAGVCAITAGLAIATVANRPDELGEVASMSWSFPLTLVGIALGAGAAIPSLFPSSAVAGAADAVTGVTDRVHRAVVGPMADLTNPKRPTVPEARVVDRPTPEPTGDDRADAATEPPSALYSDRVSQAKARGNYVAPRGGFMNKKERLALRTPVRAVDADTVKEALRFVAHRVELNDYGLHAYMRNGQQHQLAWSELERAVMRRLPTDEPYRGVVMLDLVPVGATAPVRLLPTTHVNYADLPGGAGVSAAENLKKLAVHVREQNPSAELDGTPPNFATPRAFLEYDARYG